MATAIKEIDAKTLKDWLDGGTCTLVDVREPGEHAREHVPGSTLAPLGRLDPAKLAAESPRPIVLHCASGTRSARAALQFEAAGIEVSHLAGGLSAWRNAGFPVVEDRRAPIPIMRQVQMIAGSLVLAGTALGAFVHPGFYALSAAVGGGLLFAGATGRCGMATVLSYLPYNKV
ncbi:MAG: rhodanese-like domain-containing protein [Proteobacteria bacterium]|nr:rhodanese-like domain-containing protein [Pseudomonadota bacterium]